MHPLYAYWKLNLGNSSSNSGVCVTMHIHPARLWCRHTPIQCVTALFTDIEQIIQTCQAEFIWWQMLSATNESIIEVLSTRFHRLLSVIPFYMNCFNCRLLTNQWVSLKLKRSPKIYLLRILKLGTTVEDKSTFQPATRYY